MSGDSEDGNSRWSGVRGWTVGGAGAAGGPSSRTGALSVARGPSPLTGMAVGSRNVAGADVQSTLSADGGAGPSGGEWAIDGTGPAGILGSGSGSGITPGTAGGRPLWPAGVAPGVVPLVVYQVGGTAG